MLLGCVMPVLPEDAEDRFSCDALPLPVDRDVLVGTSGHWNGSWAVDKAPAMQVLDDDATATVQALVGGVVDLVKRTHNVALRTSALYALSRFSYDERSAR